MLNKQALHQLLFPLAYTNHFGELTSFLYIADIFSALVHPVLLHAFLLSEHLLPVITGNYDTCGNTGLAYVERENAQVIFNDNDALSLGLIKEPQWSPLHRNNLFPLCAQKHFKLNLAYLTGTSFCYNVLQLHIALFWHSIYFIDVKKIGCQGKKQCDISVL